MKQYVPIEPTVNAAVILTIVRTATLDDGTNVVVDDSTQVGDFVIGEPDGSFKVDAATDFTSKYKPL